MSRLSLPEMKVLFAAWTAMCCGLAATWTCPAQDAVPVFKNSLDMEGVEIPAGEFTMGDPDFSPENKFHGPPHRVRISKPFFLGRHEVTQSQWQRVMGNNPSHFSPSGAGSADVANVDTGKLPIENITWYEALLFCNALSAKEGTPPYYELKNKRNREWEFFGEKKISTDYDVLMLGGTGYRLPTEAEWEYACRGGTTTPFHFGSVCNGTQANVNGKYPFGKIDKGPSRERPLPVGSFSANRFGLFDMHGNVSEWVYDVDEDNTYARRRGVTTDPLVAEKLIRGGENGEHVFRGGDWQTGALAASAHYRQGRHSASKSKACGFRIARDKPANQ